MASSFTTTRSRYSSRRRWQRGFSLLEALIALMLTAVVMAGISMALRTGLDASDRIRERSDSHAEARAALAILAADLRAAYLSGVNTEETYFSGKTPNEVPPGDPFLRLTTLNYRRNRASGASAQEPRSDAVQVEYALQRSAERDEPATLVRRERWTTETGEGETEVVCEQVATLRLRYQGRSEPETSWDAEEEENPPLTVYPDEAPSAPNRELPRAIEITLLLAPPATAPEGTKPRAYRTLVSLESDGVMPFESETVPPPQPGSGRGGGGGNRGGGNRGGGNTGG